MKLSLVISTLTCGGAERVLSLLANEWARRGHEVQLVTLDREPPFFALDARVRLVQLDCEQPSSNPVQSLWNLNRSVARLRRTLRAFGSEGVVAFTTRVNVKTLLATRNQGIPVVVSERVDPRMDPDTAFWTRLRDRWYPRAHRVVVQTPSVDAYFRSRGLTNLVVIPNPLDLPTGETQASPGGGDPLLFVNVARLVPQKGHDLLLRALAQTRLPVRVRLLGDGELRAPLEALAVSLGVADRVEFAGFVADKTPHWRQAGAFVLSSRYEGFPNALCEAMAAGLACVSFDCPSGPADIIQDGVNGLLVPAEDVEALARALDRLASDQDLRMALGRQAAQLSQTLGLPGVTDRWEAALVP